MERATERIEFPADGSSRWAGMGDYVLVSPDGRHELLLRYAGEPPHGDSYHEASIDGVAMPGFFWGCRFAFTSDSRFFVGSWMPRCFERHTIVVAVAKRRFLLLPVYIYDFTVRDGIVRGVGASDGLECDFGGEGIWTPF